MSSGARKTAVMETKKMSTRDKAWELMFSTRTAMSRRIDLIILWAIILSVAAVMLESVKEIQEEFDYELSVLEWVFTILFTIEYLLRIYASKNPLRYIFSFFGLVDLLSIVPTYLGLLIPGSGYGRVLRILRLLRIFRILKLSRYLNAADELLGALRASRPKIIVFLVGVLLVSTIMGTFMYIIESAESGFTSIPRSIYWAIVTVTTVGYGDISPTTVLGQTIASVLMVIGYGIIAVPTGIVSAEYAMGGKKKIDTTNCHRCHEEIRSDANFCRHCGHMQDRQPDESPPSIE